MGDHLRFVTGDITEANEKYIVHQCNCVTKRAKGLAQSIFDKYPYSNTYKLRVGPQLDRPGTIQIRGNGTSQRYVINLMGQVKGGKPKDPNDTAQKRLQYFRAGLQQIAKIPDLTSIAFPYNIGCGLAGGNWESYQAELEEFAIHANVPVVIYKFNQETNEDE